MVRPLGALPMAVGLALAAGVIGLASPLALAQSSAYTVSFVGLDDGKLRRLLESASALERLKGEPLPSPTGLRLRADSDRERLDTALRSEGHYDAAIEITLDNTHVTIHVDPGPVYRFGRVVVTAAPGTMLPEVSLDAEALGLIPNTPARAPLVIAAEHQLKEALDRHGFAFAKVTDRRVVIDREAKTLEVTFTVTPGPAVRLGAPVIHGLEQVDKALVLGRVTWQAGSPYRPELLERTRTGLTRLGVFSTIGLRISETTTADGTYPVTITVSERKRRVIGLGATFSSAEGLGGQAYWGHRNLFGGGEQLRVGGELSRLSPRTLTKVGLENADEKLTGEVRKPDFLAVNQDLVVGAAAINEHPQAYHRQALTTQARLENRLTPTLTFGYGLAGDQSNIRDTAGYTMATLAGTPLTLAWDTTDAILDPTTGYRLTVEATPWLRVGESDHSFMVNRVTQSTYHDFSGGGTVIAAGRLSIGGIVNSSTADLPADKRFYAGGGGRCAVTPIKRSARSTVRATRSAGGHWSRPAPNYA